MALTLTLITFLALAAGIAIRWVLRRVDSLGRVRRFPRISVGLCLALALACAVPLWTAARLEGTLTRAATAVAGQPVRVHCQTFAQAFTDLGAELGYVRWDQDGKPERSTLIKRDPCADLRHWLASSKHNPSRDQVVAVHVLTHETMHMAGIMNEAQTECAAVQRDAAMAVALGATQAQAEALAKRYWTEIYPNMPGDYVGGCGAGGEFDEQLPSPPW
ncbi:MAG: hypothetical protein AAGC49_03065 [Brevundimonas sp.]